MNERFTLSCDCGEELSVGVRCLEYPNDKGEAELIVEICDIDSPCACEPDEQDLIAQVLEELEWQAGADDNDAAYEDFKQNPDDWWGRYG